MQAIEFSVQNNRIEKIKGSQLTAFIYCHPCQRKPPKVVEGFNYNITSCGIPPFSLDLSAR